VAHRAPRARSRRRSASSAASRACARELEQRLEAVYREHGLEPGWHDVLATLRRNGPPYQLRPTDFSGQLMLTSSGTTKRLDRLEQAGLVDARPGPRATGAGP
jgi:DNA-binding MarR family transcriptional regulator